jgi:hypothetical protein
LTEVTGSSKPAPVIAKGRGGLRAALFRRSRRVGCGGRVHVEKPFARGIHRGVAVPIMGIGGRTLCGVFLAPRRLRVLPHHCPGKTTSFWSGRRFWEHASRRRWARIVIDPENHGARADVRLNILRGGDFHAAAFIGWHRGAIDTCLEARLAEFLRPRAKIVVVRSRKPAAFFNVEENYGARCRASIEFLSLRLSLPLNNTTNPKPCEASNSRLPCQVLRFSPGGGPSQ